MNSYKSLFPIFREYPDLIYLDSASTTQKPQEVISAVSRFYTKYNSNVGRSSYFLADLASHNLWQTRLKLQKFLNASYPEEIIFTAGATDSANLVAELLLQNQKLFCSKDTSKEILVGDLEHHSNLLPWLKLTNHGFKFRQIKYLKEGFVDMVDFKKKLSTKTKLVVLSHVSNVSGQILPVKEIVSLVHQQNSLVVVDGSQAVSHLQVDLRSLDADFYFFSAHKMYAPTGVGVLYGKKKLLDSVKPVRVGGGVPLEVKKTKLDPIKDDFTFKYKKSFLPYFLEAGTPNLAGIAGLDMAIDWIQAQSPTKIKTNQDQLTAFLIRELKKFRNLNIIHPQVQRVGIVSFDIQGINSADLGQILSRYKVAVRTGNLCAEPFLNSLGFDTGVCRVSLAIYNDKLDLVRFLEFLNKSLKILR